MITLSELDLLYNLNEGTVNSEASLCRNRITNALHIVKTVTLSADEYALEDSISKLVNKLDCPFLAKTYLHFWNAAHMNLIMVRIFPACLVASP